MNEQIEDLQGRYSFLEASFDELRAQMLDQQSQIAALQLQVRALAARLPESPPAVGDLADEPLPPHY